MLFVPIDGNGHGEGAGLDAVQQEGQLGHLRDGHEGRLQAGRHGQQRQHLKDGEFS